MEWREGIGCKSLLRLNIYRISCFFDQTVKTQVWEVDGSPAGTWVESRGLSYVKVFNSSHMVPYDLPDIAHDMILRFMGVNFSAITEGSARIPSKVGDDEKPVPVLLDGEKSDDSTIPVPIGKTPEQDKAMWEGAQGQLGLRDFVLIILFSILQRRFSCPCACSHSPRDRPVPLLQEKEKDGPRQDR